ncbi:leucine-rich repeat domain-containing protein [Candidatus Poribacteria bacterium]|nr:leucine-rich repeat domain-containing protein [Candidatus Poribacteria bacterium]
MLRLNNFYAIRDKNIVDFTGLEHAVNLKVIRLWSHPIQDFSSLIRTISGLTNLRELSLEIGGISDISPLAELTNLKHLGEVRLNGNQISDIKPLAKLTKLHKLWLHVNQISDITSLKELTNLRELRLGYNRISEITPLASLAKLNRLWLNNNQINDVTPLAELVNLQELYLEGNQIMNRKPLFELLDKNPNVKIYLELGGEPLPVTLSHFRAEHSNTGVVLKWTTESEVDNAGFYIYRSETKDGEFKVVNPTMIQGAGTTGERTEYTWTDTTAKPNTVYYYRIEDVSHAGEREQLATVRLRGLVSARGKLTTIWADLKTQ